MESLFNVEPIEAFINESVHLLDNLYNTSSKSNKLLQEFVLDETKEEIKLIILKSDYDFNRVFETLKATNLSPEKLNRFLKLLETKRKDLLIQALLQKNSQFGETMSNFDWFLKLVLGTSDLKTLQYPLLQLVLSTKSTDGSRNRRCYEIDKILVEKAINVLESIL